VQGHNRPDAFNNPKRPRPGKKPKVGSIARHIALHQIEPSVDARPPNGMPFSRTAPIDQEGIRAAFSLQNRIDLDRRTVGSAGMAYRWVAQIVPLQLSIEENRLYRTSRG